MSQSFFHLTTANDPEPHESPDTMSYCDPGTCGSYTKTEHDAVLDQAKALHDALYDALNGYSKTHPEMSYDVIFHAIDCLSYCIRQQLAEEVADA